MTQQSFLCYFILFWYEWVWYVDYQYFQFVKLSSSCDLLFTFYTFCIHKHKCVILLYILHFHNLMSWKERELYSCAIIETSFSIWWKYPQSSWKKRDKAHTVVFLYNSFTILMFKCICVNGIYFACVVLLTCSTSNKLFILFKKFRYYDCNIGKNKNHLFYSVWIFSALALRLYSKKHSCFGLFWKFNIKVSISSYFVQNPTPKS